MLENMLAHPDFWKYVSIPIGSGVIGFVTNWLAVQMTFYPKEFIGIRPIFGWQGIIPGKAEKMARIVVEKSLEKIGSISDFFQEMEPEKISAHLVRSLQSRIEEYTDEVMIERNGVLWENLPQMVRNRVYNRARRVIPDVIDGLIDDINKNIEDLVDLNDMIIRQLVEDKTLLIRCFKEVGEPEFKFVVNSGIYFGSLFGLIQIPIFIFYPENWVLPLFGFIVGVATNWMALNVIFRPLNPVKVGPIRVQGLFLKRQRDVAEQFAYLATTEMLTIRNLMTSILTGPRGDRTKVLIKRHLRPLLEGGVVRTAAQLTVGPGGYADLKRAVEDKAIDLSLIPFEDKVFNQERGVVIEKMMADKMKELSSEQFQDLLRPAFQEDEWILILVGGVLGACAGLFQLLVVFGM